MLKPEVITALASLNREEITEAWDYLRRRTKQISMQATNNFQVGQKVKFTGRRGMTLKGEIKAINQTTISVLVPDPFRGQVTWRVSASLLSEDV